MDDNVLEILIRVVDTASPQMEKVGASAKKMGDSISVPNTHLREMRRAVLVAVAALYGLERILQNVADRAKELGRADVADAFDRAKNSVQLFADTLLTIPLLNGNLLDGFKRLADGFSIAMKSMSVLAILFIDGLKGMLVTVLRLIGMVEEAVGVTTQWTAAWYNNVRAQIAAEDKLAIINAWTTDLNTNVQNLTHSLADWNKGELANVQTLEDKIKAIQKLNDLNGKRKSIEDAIRAGDARALADAMYGGGGGNGPFRGAGRSGGGNAGRPISNNKGDNIAVYVNIGGKALNSHIDKRIVKSVFGQNAKSDAARFPGKGQ